MFRSAQAKWIVAVLLVVTAFFGTWTTAFAQTQTVPIPQPIPGSPDQNIFYGATPPLAESAPVIVFVHGLRGTAEDWWVRNDMYSTVWTAGFRSAYVSLSADNSRNDSAVETNAAVLRVLLPKIADRFHVSQLYVIAHSKGGVDMEAAVLDPRLARLVKALFTVSTPNQGTELADWAYGPGRPIAAALNLLSPGLAAMQTSTMALFRAVADPILKTSGVPVYTLAGTAFSSNPLTLGTGLILRSLVSDQFNDGFVTVPRTQLSPDFAVDLGQVATDHYHTNNGTQVFAKIWARIAGIETTLAGFEGMAVTGFNDIAGSSSNLWTWTMKWFKGNLYVGTGREVLCTTLLTNDAQTGGHVSPLAQLGDLCPPIEEFPDRLAAEIWAYTPEMKEWRRVFQSPATIPYGLDGSQPPKFTA